MDKFTQNACECGTGCCTNTSQEINKRSITIDFLYLDLSICERCQDTDGVLDEALSDVKNVLELTGVDVLVNKINVNTEELAIEHQFLSSPTIRVNGYDIQMEVKENNCESCGDLCGDDVDCRVWTYEGTEYNVPPKSMVINEILKAVYGNTYENTACKPYIMPQNLKLFYTAMKKKNMSK